MTVPGAAAAAAVDEEESAAGTVSASIAVIASGIAESFGDDAAVESEAASSAEIGRGCTARSGGSGGPCIPNESINCRSAVICASRYTTCVRNRAA